MKRVSIGLLCLALVWAGLVAGCTKEKPGARAPETAPAAGMAAAEAEGGVLSTATEESAPGAEAAAATPMPVASLEPGGEVTLPTAEVGEGLLPTLTPTLTPEMTTVSIEPTSTPNAFGELIGAQNTATPTSTATPVPVLTAQPVISTPVPSAPTPAVPPPTVAAPAPAPAPVGITYVVRWGDTLFSIAMRFGVSVEGIKAANRLSGDVIVVGQQLVIPGATSPQPGGGGGTSIVHIVQPGETLSQIALLYNTTIEAIAQANGITNIWYIYVGQQLLIPSSRGGAIQPAPQPGGTYVVQPGDTLYSIAVHFKTTVQALMVMNNLGNANLLYPGQVLRVP
jgi:LysM repeat protein